MVIYTTPSFAPTISSLRGSLPVTVNTDFNTPFDVPPMHGIESVYTEQHAKLDPEKKRHNPMLYATWNAKAWLLQDAASRYGGNATSTSADRWFFWCDAGGLRQDHVFRNWPDKGRVEDVFDQVSKGTRGDSRVEDLIFMQIYDAPPRKRRWRLWKQDDGTVDLGMMSEGSPKHSTRLRRLIERFSSSGSFFGGRLQAIKWFSSEFYSLHDYYLSRNVFVGKDQNLFNTLLFLHPSRFLAVWPRDPLRRFALQNSRIEGTEVPERKCTWDVWYYFFYWLASEEERRSMRRFLVDGYDKETSWVNKIWDWAMSAGEGECKVVRAWSFKDVLKETAGR